MYHIHKDMRTYTDCRPLFLSPSACNKDTCTGTYVRAKGAYTYTNTYMHIHKYY